MTGPPVLVASEPNMSLDCEIYLGQFTRSWKSKHNEAANRPPGILSGNC
jgi:hypothetical protein